MKTINTKRFEVGIHDKVEGVIRTGWFEHNDYGDEYGGGLWFENEVVVDYDGIGGYLPAEILESLEAEGFNVDDMRPDQ